MANMSYCRFRNTLAALRDCASVLDSLLNDPAHGEDAAALSDEELAAAVNLGLECLGIVEGLAMVASNGSIDDLTQDGVRLALSEANHKANALGPDPMGDHHGRNK